MSYMKAFIYWWGREDILFASAVVPAAFVWISFESILAGLFAWTFSYVAIVGLYEYLATKRNWPSAAAAILVKDIWRSFNPQ